MSKKITEIFFSPGGTTKTISKMFCEAAGWENTTKIDLLGNKNPLQQSFDCTQAVVVAMPVFAGRIPSTTVKQLQQFSANNTPAIAIVVFGNREYEDALLELTNLLNGQGFTVVGAGAFVARHSIFPEVAADRPDEKDKKILQEFADQCLQKIEAGTNEPLQVSGNTPYREVSSKKVMWPTASKACNSCGICAKLCPVNAISVDAPNTTNKDLCINCTACIYNCPSGARSFKSPIYVAGNLTFKKKCAAYKTPTIFV